MKGHYYLVFFLSLLFPKVQAQDSLYFMKSGKIINRYSTTDIDSIVIYSQYQNVTVQDIDNNIYETVKLGNQTWMRENLRTTKFNDGTPISEIQMAGEWSFAIKPAFCWYDNTVNSYTVFYGALYNGYAVQSGKLCPIGWHVPTDAEWTELENFLIANGYNYDGTKTENKIAKAISAIYLWEPSEVSGVPGNKYDYTTYRDLSRFKAIPAGHREPNGLFSLKGYQAKFWTATPYDGNMNYIRWINFDEVSTIKSYFVKRSGYSVRCIKNQ